MGIILWVYNIEVQLASYYLLLLTVLKIFKMTLPYLLITKSFSAKNSVEFITMRLRSDKKTENQIPDAFLHLWMLLSSIEQARHSIFLKCHYDYGK